MPTITEDKLVWDFINAIWICGGVISGLLAILRTSSWSRRQGISNIDFGILPVFVAYTARYMGLVFFAVIFLGIFFVAVYYTGGGGMPWTRDGPLTRFVRTYIAVAFGLRAFDILLRIVRQSMAECFFIDWEKPKSSARPTNSAHKNSIESEAASEASPYAAAPKTTGDVPTNITQEQQLVQRAALFYAQQQQNTTTTAAGQVSVWRTYFLAHRWLELLARRTVSPLLLYSTAYLILAHSSLLNEVALIRPAASTSAGNDFADVLAKQNGTDAALLAPQFVLHPLNRLATITCTIFAIAIVYYTFVHLILERYYVNPVYQLIDLCSVCNISVLIFSHRLFGYYIHGRSPFGAYAADTGHRALSEMLLRESDSSLSSVVAQRGLTPGDDLQTFCMVITEQFRTSFTRLVSGVSQPTATMPSLSAAINSMAMLPMTIPQVTTDAAALGTTTIDKNEEKLREAHQRADAYARVNNFLMNFIQHEISALPYVVKRRVWLESIIDAEFRLDANQQQQQFSVMFSDPAAQFESLFLRGIEVQLWIFECLLFVLIDLNTESIALATAVTLLSTWLTSTLRRVLGKIMLFRHALLDERFLS